MVNFQIESWAALAPGLENKADWQRWLAEPQPIDKSLGKVALKKIPPLLRRRFTPLGKCAMGATLQLIKEGENIPSIFASRHGDTALTFSLLEDIGRDEPMSPTGFSLAVHNAVSGLYTIARKDTSTVTAIAAIQGLILNTLFEAIGQLQTHDRVLCVIYDEPLPDLYCRYTLSEEFPYAIAMILNNTQGESYTLEQDNNAEQINEAMSKHDAQSMQFLELLTGLTTEIKAEMNGNTWSIKKAVS